MYPAESPVVNLSGNAQEPSSLTFFPAGTHKFPEPSHTYLDSDRDFAQIEKKVRRHENIYTVD